MSWLLLTVLGVAGFQDPATPTSTELARARMLLAGVWTVEAITDDGDVIANDLIRSKLAKDGRATFTSRIIRYQNPESGQDGQLAFTLNPATLPRQINVIASDERTMPGIYKIEGDELIICLADGYKSTRPTEFESKPGSFRMLFRLRHTPSDPTSESAVVLEAKKEVETQPEPEILRVASPRRGTPAEIARDRDLLAGTWQILSIEDDGERLGADLIREKVAEDGRVRIGSRGVSIVSPTDQSKTLWAYRIDPGPSPKEIDLITQFDSILKGIYTFDGDKLLVCTARNEDGPRPTDFSAPRGSGRVYYTFKMARPEAKPAPAPPPPPPPSEAELALERENRIRGMIAGSWQVDDSRGSIVASFRPDGTFKATRTMARKRLFEPQTKSADGTWTYAGGVLTARVNGTSDLNWLGYSYVGRLQSIGESTMVASDSHGLKTFKKLR